MRCVRQRIMDEDWRNAFLQCALCSPNNRMSCTCCVIGCGLIFLCIVRCWSCVTNGRTMDENERDAFQLLPPPPAPPQYKRSPWDSFLRHFYSKMNTIVDILGWRRLTGCMTRIVASSCCMTTALPDLIVLLHTIISIHPVAVLP